MNFQLKKSFTSKFLIVTGQCIVSGGNFLATVLLAREFDLNIFGLFSSIWLIILFSSSLVMAISIFPMMTNYFKFDRDERNDYMSGTFGILILIFSFLLLFAAFLNSYLNSIRFYSVSIYVWPVALCIISINLQEFVRRSLITMGHELLAFTSDAFTHILRLIIILFFSYIESLTLYNSLLTYTFTALIGSSIIFKSIKIDRRKIVSNISYAWAQNFRSVKWLLPSGLMQWSSVNLFISSAAFLISPAAVGIIRICQSLLAVFNIIIQSFESIFSPKFTKINQNLGELALARYLAKVALFGSIPFILLSILFIFYGLEIIQFIYGDNYGEVAYESLIIYSIAYIFIFLTVPIRAALRSLEITKHWFNAYLASSIFSILSVYYLEVNFGIYGAVWGILLANIILIGYTIIALLHHFKKSY
jgi:O-antigen/teichoic acid export membrane protein